MLGGGVPIFRRVYPSFAVELEKSVFPLSIDPVTTWLGVQKLIPLDQYVFYSILFQKYILVSIDLFEYLSHQFNF